MANTEAASALFNSAPIGSEMLNLARELVGISGAGLNLDLLGQVPPVAMAHASLVTPIFNYGIHVASNGWVTTLKVEDLRQKVLSEDRKKFSHAGTIAVVEAGTYDANGKLIDPDDQGVTYVARLNHPTREVKQEGGFKTSLYERVVNSVTEAVVNEFGSRNFIFYTE